MTSTLNQLSMPWLMNSSDDTYTMRSGTITSAPKIPTVRAVVAHQAPQLARQQHAQRNHRAGINQQDPQLQAPELGGVLHTLGEQQEGAEPDATPQQHLAGGQPTQAARRALAYTGSDHVYHSEVRAQSSVQNMIARMEEVRWPRRTPARTLML